MIGKNRNHETCKPRKFSAIRYITGRRKGLLRQGLEINEDSQVKIAFDLVQLTTAISKTSGDLPYALLHYLAAVLLTIILLFGGYHGAG